MALDDIRAGAGAVNDDDVAGTRQLHNVEEHLEEMSDLRMKAKMDAFQVKGWLVE